MVRVRTPAGLYVLDLFTGSPMEFHLAREMVLSALFGTQFSTKFMLSRLLSLVRAWRC